MLSGECGFDPLSLGTNPDTLKWFAEAELTNGRWAMAAVAGILFTELVGLPKFWLAGAEVSQLVPEYGAFTSCLTNSMQFVQIVTVPFGRK